MIYLKQAIVVEGKYDKIKVSSCVKAFIITTDGFRIFKSESKKKLIKFLAKKTGVVVLTDSDLAGQLIRNHIKSFIKDGQVFYAYIPKIAGKEKRKLKFSKSGCVGVEAMDESTILKSLEQAGVFINKRNKNYKFTNLNLMEAGLLGLENSSFYRKQFLKQLNLPDYLSTKQLLEFLNSSFSYDQFKFEVLKFRGRIG